MGRCLILILTLSLVALSGCAPKTPWENSPTDLKPSPCANFVQLGGEWPGQKYVRLDVDPFVQFRGVRRG
ncbi:uncharacterized protein DFE_A0053 (plasmid) [Desulfovibrio ferrophilus]|uniref:Lipoprotein n=1 Tax=Desulfovibrio ferrophilus TaxID=241368 RepID=A0A2Z6B3R0_9BACT|nr:uncharacterized protein DFE_A0053 [Desulfovibrio ferrophilus]